MQGRCRGDIGSSPTTWHRLPTWLGLGLGFGLGLGLGLGLTHHVAEAAHLVGVVAR